MKTPSTFDPTRPASGGVKRRRYLSDRLPCSWEPGDQTNRGGAVRLTLQLAVGHLDHSVGDLQQETAREHRPSRGHLDAHLDAHLEAPLTWPPVPSVLKTYLMGWSLKVAADWMVAMAAGSSAVATDPGGGARETSTGEGFRAQVGGV